MKVNHSKRQEKLLMIVVVCYAIAAGTKMGTLYEAFQEKNKAKITTSMIMLLLFLTSFICFLIILRRANKKGIADQALK